MFVSLSAVGLSVSTSMSLCEPASVLVAADHRPDHNPSELFSRV